jgi:hypothetical protein
VYTAVIVCAPAVRPAAVSVALPLLSSGAVPRRVELSSKLTVPVGGLAPLDVAVVLRTTGVPGAEAFGEDVSEVVLELLAVVAVVPPGAVVAVVGVAQVSGGLVSSVSERGPKPASAVLTGLGSLGAPVLVESALNLAEPDDGPGDGKQDPESGGALNGAHLPPQRTLFLTILSHYRTAPVPKRLYNHHNNNPTNTPGGTRPAMVEDQA